MSPEPWADARARLTATVDVPIEWPNEVFDTPEPPGLWVSVRASGDVLEPIEMGDGAWCEEGSLFVTVMTPLGWGSDQARALAKRIANAFRGLGPAPTLYTGANIGAGRLTDPDGTWWGLTVTVGWRFTDVMPMADA